MTTEYKPSGSIRLDAWTMIEQSPCDIPLKVVTSGTTVRGFDDKQEAIDYANLVARFFRTNGVNQRIFVVEPKENTGTRPVLGVHEIVRPKTRRHARQTGTAHDSGSRSVGSWLSSLGSRQAAQAHQQKPLHRFHPETKACSG